MVIYHDDMNISYLESQKVIKSEETARFEWSQCSSISEAFLYLTSNISKLLQKEDFYSIRRSCIEQINTPSGAQLSPDMVQKIKSTKDLDSLLDTVAMSPYWSWIDLRLLEAMVTASGSLRAKALLTDYRNVVFSKKLIEVLPTPNREIRDAYYSKIVSKIRKDLEWITIYDLLQYQSQLETVIMDLKNGTCSLAYIEEGCIKACWFIPTHHIDCAYKSACLKDHKFRILDLQYLQIGTYKKIYDPSSLCFSETAIAEIPPVSDGKTHSHT